MEDTHGNRSTTLSLAALCNGRMPSPSIRMKSLELHECCSFCQNNVFYTSNPRTVAGFMEHKGIGDRGRAGADRGVACKLHPIISVEKGRRITCLLQVVAEGKTESTPKLDAPYGEVHARTEVIHRFVHASAKHTAVRLDLTARRTTQGVWGHG